jgi:hypothetical protein
MLTYHSTLLDRLDHWKSRYGGADTGPLERLLETANARRFRDAGALIRLHETVLFLRAYPPNLEVARLADAILLSFADRVQAIEAAGGDLAAFEEPEISGIAGTSLSAVFSYAVARRLAARRPRDVEIAWDRYDEAEKLGPVTRRFLPLLEEEWPVEAHVPCREWMAAGRRPGAGDLTWLLERLGGLPLEPKERAELYETLQLPLTWRMGRSRISRTRLRLPQRRLYCHREPLLRRRDVSLGEALEGPPLPLRRLSPPEARGMADLILDTSAMRYRELYGFSHPDTGGVFHADAGRGVEIFFCGVPPAWRLPLRAYHAGMFFKNGVPAGYVELLSLFDRAEVGFNLYYTFREGESAWLYARLLRLFRQVLGVNCFSVDPYQIGFENPEAIDSGAFWFYRKLGFRPVAPEVAKVAAREEHKMRLTPGYRSSRRTLEKLAGGYVVFDGPGAEPGAWDNFRVRHLGLAVGRAMAERFDGDAEAIRRAARIRTARTLGIESSSGLALVVSLIPDLERWTAADKLGVRKILEAKEAAAESRYLRLMQRHARLRAAFLALGVAQKLNTAF